MIRKMSLLNVDDKIAPKKQKSAKNLTADKPNSELLAEDFSDDYQEEEEKQPSQT